MSSSPYRRDTVEIENGNLAMVLATNIRVHIGYKGLLQVYLYSVQIYGGLFTNIADIDYKLKVKLSNIRCFHTPLTILNSF